MSRRLRVDYFKRRWWQTMWSAIKKFAGYYRLFKRNGGIMDAFLRSWTISWTTSTHTIENIFCETFPKEHHCRECAVFFPNRTLKFMHRNHKTIGNCFKKPGIRFARYPSDGACRDFRENIPVKIDSRNIFQKTLDKISDLCYNRSKSLVY